MTPPDEPRRFQLPDHVLELKPVLLVRTVKRTREALTGIALGEVLAVHTNDP